MPAIGKWRRVRGDRVGRVALEISVLLRRARCFGAASDEPTKLLSQGSARPLLLASQLARSILVRALVFATLFFIFVFVVSSLRERRRRSELQSLRSESNRILLGTKQVLRLGAA